MIGKLVLATSLVSAAAFADKPAPQLADYAKIVSGTMKCTGSSVGPDGKPIPFSGTFTSKIDLDGWWIHETFDGFEGTGATGHKYKFESFATFDPSTKKWRRVFVDNWGAQMFGTSDDLVNGKFEAVYEMQGNTLKGTAKDSVDISDPKKGVQFSGQSSKDGGKTWTKTYELSCKK